MATKTKLEKTIEKQAAALNPAEREIVMCELRVYKVNLTRIKDYEARMKKSGLDPDEEKSLLTRRHQLVTENTAISTKLLRHLKGAVVEEDELEGFM